MKCTTIFNSILYYLPTVMVEVSEDIFYQVKKQILDKLDVVLQKVNLEIINYIHPAEEEFDFIELSFFEHEIQHLFHYLDRLYTSLNSSVSFSSIHSYKSTVENFQIENQRLASQNEELRKEIQRLDEKAKQDFTKKILKKRIDYRNVPKVQLSNLIVSVRQFEQEVREFSRDIKKTLKNCKFQMLQGRVEIISKLKQFQMQKNAIYQEMNEKGEDVKIKSLDKGEGGQDILIALNEILSIC